MKTFKLISLKIVKSEDEDIEFTEIPLLDGLIINQEDEKNRWVIEAYMNKRYDNYFQQLKAEDEIIIQVKITKESNEPAVFITSIIDINEIDSNMNVVFMGKIIDQRKSKIETMLEKLIKQGLEGEELLKQFKKMIRQ